MAALKFSENTTATEIMNFYRDSVFDLLEELETMFDGYSNTNMPERMVAVKTRRKLLAWFDSRGGL